MKAYIKNKTVSYEDKITDWFSEYLSFINFQPIPFPNNIKIEIFDGKKDNHGLSFGQLRRIGDTGKNFQFSIEQTMLLCEPKITLFHEFTHIMDFVVLNQFDNYDEFYDLYSIMSEIKASFVEYAVITGSKNIEDMSAPFSYKNFKCSFNKKPSPITSLPKQFSTDIIYSAIKGMDYSPQFGVKLIRQIMYYIGMCICIVKKTGIKIDHSDLINEMKKYYGNNINELIEQGLHTDVEIKDIILSDAKRFNDIYNKCSTFYRDLCLPKYMEMLKKQI